MTPGVAELLAMVAPDGASFGRMDAASGATIASSLATTVVTPSKCPVPRPAPSSVSVRGPRTTTVVAKPSG